MEQIRAMFDAIDKDTAFCEEINLIMEQGTAADIVSAASKKGFNFTESDWQSYLDWSKTVIAMEKVEISESELENITGGKGGSLFHPRMSSKCYYVAGNVRGISNGVLRNKCTAVCLRTEQGSGDGWWRCKCYGSDICVNRRHYITENGSPLPRASHERWYS